MNDQTNYYLALELFLDPPERDWDRLQEKLREKRNEWNKKRNNPDGLKYQSLCEDFDTIIKTLQNEDERKKQANAAKRKRLAELDELIVEVANGDSIAPSQVETIIEQYKIYLKETTIRSRIEKNRTIAEPAPTVATLPAPQKPKDNPDVDLCGSVTLGKIQEHLEILNQKDVYEALGVRRAASLSELTDAAQQLIEKARRSIKKTAKISSTGELGGLLKEIFQSEAKRKGFEISWARYQIEKALKRKFSLRIVNKTISLDAFNRSIQDVREKGISEDEALWLVYDYFVNKRGCPDPRTLAATISEPKTSCPNCYHLNPIDANVCQNCGYRLRVKCPKCGTEGASQGYCRSCGFNFNELEKFQDYLRDLRDALSTDNFEVAADAYNKARIIWPTNPDLKSFVGPLRDLNARRVFQDLERELDAGQLENARSLSTKLSFDGESTPLIAQLKSDFEKRYQKEKKIAGLINEANAFAAQRRFFDAVAKVEEALKQAPQRPALLDKKNEFERNVAEARRRLEEAKRARGEKNQEDELTRLSKEYPDFDEALDALDSVPPSAPFKAEANETANGVEIRWSKSESNGDVTYRIFRRSVDSPTDSNGERVCDSTRQTAFVDEKVETFTRYRYLIYAERNGVESSPRQTNEVVKIGDITDVRTTAGDGTFSAEWTRVKGATNISVERRRLSKFTKTPETNELRDATQKTFERQKSNEISGPLDASKISFGGFSDFGLQNDVEYEYAVKIQYVGVNGEIAWTEPHYITGTPFKPLQPLNDSDWEVSFVDDEFRFSWKRPNKGDVRFYLSDKPLNDSATQAVNGAFSELQNRFGDPLVWLGIPTNDNDRQTARCSKTGALVQYATPVTIDKSYFACGKSRAIVSFSAIKHVSIERFDHQTYVAWEWSPKATGAYILWSERDWPQGVDDKSCRKERLLKTDYEIEQAWKTSIPIYRTAFVAVYQFFEQDGRTFCSAGARFVLKMSLVRYSPYVQANGKNGAEKFVKFQCVDERGTIPNIVVVKRSGRPPLRRNDGEIVLTIPATNKTTLDVNFDEVFRNAQYGDYYRCYLANVSDRAYFALLDPARKDLRLYDM